MIDYPKDWIKEKLGNIISTYAGGTPKSDRSEYYGEGYKWIKSGDLNQGRIKDVDESITELGLQNSSSKVVEPGTLLLAIYGATAGVIAITEIKATINQAVLAIKPEEEIEKNFLLYWFHFHKGRIIHIYTQGGQPNLSAKTVKSLPISLPDVSEQNKIATTISNWDKAISTLEDLIQAKKRCKKGLMQQLLNGQKRFPEFEGEPWVEVKIGDLLKEVERDIEWDDSALYDLISVKRRSEGIVHRESLYGHEIKTKNLKDVKEGDFIISRMQVLHGASALASKEFEGTKVSGSYHTLVAHNSESINLEFFNYLSQTPYLYHLAYISSHGVHIEKMTFKIDDYLEKKIKIPPSVGEQRKIANVLLIADKEIELLKEEMAAIKKQKKGLMQQLLTGKVRVNKEK
jgi:type I restriction enzyme S subunit